MKKCSKCKLFKNVSEFYKHSNNGSKDGLCSQCKECVKLYHKTEHSRNLSKKYQETEKAKGTRKKYRKTQSCLDSYKRYRKTEKGILSKKKYDSSPVAKLRRILRTRLYYAIVGKAKKGSAIRDLGCDINWFIEEWLPVQFHVGMSWDNFGVKNKDENGCYWEIDHIIPFKDIDVTNEEQIKMVVHYHNLRPCWHWANLARNSHNDSEIDFSSPTPKYFEIHYEEK